MHIVKILGGLGNQMFQYAFALELSKRFNTKVLLDLSSFGSYSLHNGYELERIFNIKADLADFHDVKKLATLPTNILSRFKRKYLTKKTHFIDRYFGYDENVFEPVVDRYYEGYWQSEKYFISCIDEVKKAFLFEADLGSKNIKILENADSTLAVHVRRGDFLKSHNMNVCGKEYYLNALEHAYTDTNLSTVCFFSDDLEWCKTHLPTGERKVEYVNWNSGAHSWRDMAIMSKCVSIIISNSSFSWWAAYLNEHSNKKIYAPEIWNRRQIEHKDHYYSFSFDDIVPQDWIRIENGTTF